MIGICLRQLRYGGFAVIRVVVWWSNEALCGTLSHVSAHIMGCMHGPRSRVYKLNSRSRKYADNMGSEADTSIPTFTVIHADGLYEVYSLLVSIPGLLLIPREQDDRIEHEIFRSSTDPPDYNVNYSQVNLRPAGTTTAKPWSDIDKSLRDQVDGITLLMLTFTAADLALFPRLKV